MSRSVLLKLLAVASVAAAAACGPRGGVEAPSPQARGDDREFLTLAAEVPGFAGFYLAADTLVVLLVDARWSERAADRASEVVTRWDPELRIAATRVEAAAYTYEQLQQAYRGLVGAGLFGQEGVVAAGIDVAGNRVAVEVEEEGAALPVERIVRRAGLRRDAIRIDVSGPIVF